MATELLELQLEELSLVDRPANAEAMVTLFKRDDTQEEDIDKMTDEQNAKVKAYMDEHNCGKDEAMKALGYDVEKADEVDPTEELKAEIETLKADAETLTQENERLRKGLIDEGYVIKSESIEKKAPEEYIEVEGEQINKADVPAPILKALEAAEFAKADAELTKRAEETLPNFDVAVAKELVKAFSEEEKIIEALKAADAAFEAKMEELGDTAEETFASAQEELDAMIKAHMEANSVTKAKATTEVTKGGKGRELYKQAMKESK